MPTPQESKHQCPLTYNSSDEADQSSEGTLPMNERQCSPLEEPSPINHSLKRHTDSIAPPSQCLLLQSSATRSGLLDATSNHFGNKPTNSRFKKAPKPSTIPNVNIPARVPPTNTIFEDTDFVVVARPPLIHEAMPLAHSHSLEEAMQPLTTSAQATAVVSVEVGNSQQSRNVTIELTLSQRSSTSSSLKTTSTTTTNDSQTLQQENEKLRPDPNQAPPKRLLSGSKRTRREDMDIDANLGTDILNFSKLWWNLFVRTYNPKFESPKCSQSQPKGNDDNDPIPGPQAGPPSRIIIDCDSLADQYADFVHEQTISLLSSSPEFHVNPQWFAFCILLSTAKVGMVTSTKAISDTKQRIIAQASSEIIASFGEMLATFFASTWPSSENLNTVRVKMEEDEENARDRNSFHSFISSQNQNLQSSVRDMLCNAIDFVFGVPSNNVDHCSIPSALQWRTFIGNQTLPVQAIAGENNYSSTPISSLTSTRVSGIALSAEHYSPQEQIIVSDNQNSLAVPPPSLESFPQQEVAALPTSFLPTPPQGIDIRMVEAYPPSLYYGNSSPTAAVGVDSSALLLVDDSQPMQAARPIRHHHHQTFVSFQLNNEALSVPEAAGPVADRLTSSAGPLICNGGRLSGKCTRSHSGFHRRSLVSHQAVYESLLAELKERSKPPHKVVEKRDVAVSTEENNPMFNANALGAMLGAILENYHQLSSNSTTSVGRSTSVASTANLLSQLRSPPQNESQHIATKSPRTSTSSGVMSSGNRVSTSSFASSGSRVAASNSYGQSQRASSAISFIAGSQTQHSFVHQRTTFASSKASKNKSRVVTNRIAAPAKHEREASPPQISFTQFGTDSQMPLPIMSIDEDPEQNTKVPNQSQIKSHIKWLRVTEINSTWLKHRKYCRKHDYSSAAPKVNDVPVSLEVGNDTTQLTSLIQSIVRQEQIQSNRELQEWVRLSWHEMRNVISEALGQNPPNP